LNAKPASSRDAFIWILLSMYQGNKINHFRWTS